MLHVRAEQSQISDIRFDSHENNIANRIPARSTLVILCVETITVKKLPVPFPATSWDVTYQTLSSWEYVSLMKTGVFPDIFFPSPEFKGAEFFSQRPNFMATLAGAPVASQESSGNFPGSSL